jgi:hypothetical protein
MIMNMSRNAGPFALALLLATIAVAQEAEYRAAIFWEPSMPVVGAATPPETFERVFKEQGIPTARLSADQVCDPAAFNADLYDLLVTPMGASYPAAGKEALVAFLKRGGDLFCTGGYAFDALFVRQDGKWVPQDDLLKAARAQAADPAVSLLPNGGFENGGEGWFPIPGNECTLVSEPGCTGTACGQAANTAAEGGCAWRTVLPVESGKTYLVGARIKTGPVQGSGYAFMAVYQYAADGKILHFTDFIQKQQAADWQRYETMVDVVPGATRVEFSAGFFRASGTAWIDDVTCAPIPREVRINAHYGKPEDGLIVEPDQLMMFSPDQRYEGVMADARTPLADCGYEATAQLGGTARWSLLDWAYSNDGKAPAARVALVHHFGGLFSGSTWVLAGVDKTDFFADGAQDTLLARAAGTLKKGVYLRGIETNHSFYRHGEPVAITVRLSNASRVPRWQNLLCVVSAGMPAERKNEGLGSELAAVAPGEDLLRQYFWTVPQGDLHKPMAWVQLGEAVQGLRQHDPNFLETPLCIEHECISNKWRVQLRAQDNAYFLQSRSDRSGSECKHGTCLFGTDTYANMFSSPNQTIAAWGGTLGDLSAMRSHGLDMFENLQFTPENYTYSDRQWRQLDALIQTAQDNELIYMAGLLVGQDVAVSDEELEKQAAMCATFAQRYKEVRGLIYYLNGDFQLKMKDLPDLRREWNALLGERYGSDAAARVAWKEIIPADDGSLPVADRAAQSWYDPKARDVAEFKMRLMRRWVNRLCDAIHAVDKKDAPTSLDRGDPPPSAYKQHPITAEYYQRTYNGIDLRLTMEPMDAANFGYFDMPKRDMAKLMATIKWNDMRLADKMVNIGEFGVKTHDAWTPERGGMSYHLRRTSEEYDQLVWWVVHSALSMGVSKIQNWCWSDDPDRIFPWGLCYNNPLRPKPVLELYSALRKAAEHVRIDYTPADTVFVMPDSWRTGAPEDFSHNTLINAHECLLAVNVPYDTANEAHLDRLLQKPPKWVVMPMAYAMSDAMLDKVRALAEAGSLVYLSGDLSIGPDGTRKPERLESLCGVKFESETTHPTGPPVPVASVIDAKEVENPAGLKLYRREVGKGAILWTPEPWETLKGKEIFVEDPGTTADPKQNLYLTIAPMAGIAPAVKLTADSGVWRVMVTPTAGRRLVTVFPRKEVTTPVKVNVKGDGFSLDFEFRKTWPAMVLLDEKNQAVMATGTGPLILNGQPVPCGSGTWINTPGENTAFNRVYPAS